MLMMQERVEVLEAEVLTLRSRSELRSNISLSGFQAGKAFFVQARLRLCGQSDGQSDGRSEREDRSEHDDVYLIVSRILRELKLGKAAACWHRHDNVPDVLCVEALIILEQSALTMDVGADVSKALSYFQPEEIEVYGLRGSSTPELWKEIVRCSIPPAGKQGWARGKEPTAWTFAWDPTYSVCIRVPAEIPDDDDDPEPTPVDLLHPISQTRRRLFVCEEY